MPINKDKAKVSLEFDFENDTCTAVVKFHHTNIGPTITSRLRFRQNALSDYALPEGIDSVMDFSLPVDFFVEVVDFLRQQNAIEGGSDIALPQSKNKSKSTLPIPQVRRNSQDAKQEVSSKSKDDKVKNTNTDEPLQTFAGVAQPESDTNKGENTLSKQTQENEVEEVANVNMTAKDFINEREKAAKKQKKAKKVARVGDDKVGKQEEE